MAMGIVLERASELLYGPDGKVVVDVRADFEHGSFLINFDLVQPVQEIVNLLGSEATRNVLQYLFGTGIGTLGVFGLLRPFRKGDVEPTQTATEALAPPPPTADSRGSDPGSGITIDASGSTNLRITIAQDAKLQQGIAGIVAPVKNNPGIHSVSFIAEEEVVERVSAEEAELFEAPEPTAPEDFIATDRVSATLPIIAVAFGGKRSNVWYFTYNNGKPFSAPILDEDFLDHVHHRDYVFGMGDALRVEAEVVTSRKAGRLSYDWKILKVLGHLKGVVDTDEDTEQQHELL